MYTPKVHPISPRTASPASTVKVHIRAQSMPADVHSATNATAPVTTVNAPISRTDSRKGRAAVSSAAAVFFPMPSR